MKLKSFGLVEAMIASFVAITVLSGAVALANSVNKSSSTESAYFKAEQIANNFFENLNTANSIGEIFFDSRSSLVDKTHGTYLYSINCFDSSQFQTCRTELNGAIHPDYLSFFMNENRTEADPDDPPYYKINHFESGDSFSEGYFKIKSVVRHYKDTNGNDACPTVSSISISPDKCRIVDVQIKWSDNTGDRQYDVSRYYSDWTR